MVNLLELSLRCGSDALNRKEGPMLRDVCTRVYVRERGNDNTRINKDTMFRHMFDTEFTDRKE
jgi:hypothetical protein